MFKNRHTFARKFGAVVALVSPAAVFAGAAPSTAQALAESISWTDATAAVLIGTAAIIGFRVLTTAADIVLQRISKAKGG
jgi:hypothetical protein